MSERGIQEKIIMVSKIKPLIIDQICNTCIGELKLGVRVEMGIYKVDQHG